MENTSEKSELSLEIMYKNSLELNKSLEPIIFIEPKEPDSRFIVKIIRSNFIEIIKLSENNIKKSNTLFSSFSNQWIKDFVQNNENQIKDSDISIRNLIFTEFKNSIIEYLFSFENYYEIKASKNQNYFKIYVENPSPKINEGIQNNKIYLFENYETNSELEILFKDLNFYDDLPSLEEDSIVGLLSIICFNSQNEEEIMKKILKLVNSCCYNPINAYKIWDSLVFLISSYEDFENLNKKDIDTENLDFSMKFFKTIKDYSGLKISINMLKVKEFTYKIMENLIKKKLIASLLVNGYTDGSSEIIFEDVKYIHCSFTQKIREILSKNKLMVLKETILEKILDNYSNLSILNTINENLIFNMETCKNKIIESRKIVCKLPKIKIANIIFNKFTIIEIISNYKEFEIFSNNPRDLIEYSCIILLKTFKEFENISIENLNFLNEFKIKNELIEQITLMEDEKKKSYYLKKIMEDIQKDYLALKKFKNHVINFYELIMISIVDLKKINIHENDDNIQKNLSQFKEIFLKNETILKFFQNYFDFIFELLKMVGNNGNLDTNYETNRIFQNNNKILKVFFKLYFHQITNDEKSLEIEKKEVEMLKISKFKTVPLEEAKIFGLQRIDSGKLMTSDTEKNNSNISLDELLTAWCGKISEYIVILSQIKLEKNKTFPQIYIDYLRNPIISHKIPMSLKFMILTY